MSTSQPRPTDVTPLEDIKIGDDYIILSKTHENNRAGARKEVFGRVKSIGKYRGYKTYSDEGFPDDKTRIVHTHEHYTVGMYDILDESGRYPIVIFEWVDIDGNIIPPRFESKPFRACRITDIRLRREDYVKYEADRKERVRRNKERDAERRSRTLRKLNRALTPLAHAAARHGIRLDPTGPDETVLVSPNDATFTSTASVQRDTYKDGDTHVTLDIHTFANLLGLDYIAPDLKDD